MLKTIENGLLDIAEANVNHMEKLKLNGNGYMIKTKAIENDMIFFKNIRHIIRKIMPE